MYGVDGTFAFFEALTFATSLAKSRSEGLDGDDISYRAQMDYGGDRYGLQIERLVVGRNFNPEVGFLRRSDMYKNFALARFSPRPASIPSVRKFSGTGQITYIEDGAGRVTTRVLDGEFGIEFQNSDRFQLGLNEDYELITRQFSITPGALIPVGGYGFTTGRMGYTLGQQRPFSGTILVERGSFYGGDRTAITYNRARLNFSPQLSVEPNVSFNWLDLSAGSFTTKLLGSRVTYTLTPRLFASALLQYNSSTRTIGTNARLRWEYAPGSELFIVLNEERDSEAAPACPACRTDRSS